MNRIIIGFLAVPILISALTGIENGQLSGKYISSMDMALIALVIAYAHFTLLGLPALLICIRLKNLEWWTAAIAGILSSQAIPFILLLRGYGSLRFPLYFGAWGLFGSVTFWWIAIGSNADAPFVKHRNPSAALLAIAVSLFAIPLSHKLNYLRR